MTTHTVEEKKAVFPLAGWVVLAVLAVIGIASWGYEATRKLADVGLGQQVVWGLYIAGFFTAAGAGAGLLFFASLGKFKAAVSSQERFKLLSLSLASLILAGILILMDLGEPLNAWRIAFSGRWDSLMVWDFYLLAATVVVALVAWLLARKDRANGIVNFLAMLFAAGLVIVESLMLADQAAHPFWNGGLTVVSFLLGSAAAALGAALFVLDEKSRAVIKSVLVYVLGASLVLIAAEVLTMVISDEVRTRLLVKAVFSGNSAAMIWLYLLAGILIPLVLLVGKSRSRSVALTAGALVIFGVLLEKTWVLSVGLAQPWLDLPIGTYTPAWIELVGVVGMTALGILIYQVALKLEGKKQEAIE